MPKIAALGSLSSRGFGEFAQQTAANYIEDVFSTYLYTGTGSSQNITNGIDLSGKGGLVWTKNRNNTQSHYLIDSARGISKLLNSNNAFAQGTDATDLTSFNNNGYTVQGGDINASTYTYAGWTFRKQPKFFDVVTYTGNSTNATSGNSQTINHNLGSTPGMIFIKKYQNGASSDAEEWVVYHRSLGATQGLYLNLTSAAYTSSQTFNNTNPTSTTFTVGPGYSVNNNNSLYVAYLFAHDAGGFGADGSQNVISCGSFTTDGSGDATVNLGWEPQWMMWKASSTTGNWRMLDNMRGWTMGNDESVLSANLSDAETTGSSYGNPTSTGFTVTNLSSSATHIYLAIRRGPMRVPTDATKVFQAESNNSSSPQRMLPDAGDLFMMFGDKTSPTTPAWLWTDRLRGITSTSGNPILNSASDSSEATRTTSPYTYRNTSNENRLTFVPSSNNATFRFSRAPSFFDIAAYGGTGSARTVSHNLTVVPELIMVKVRNDTNAWVVYSSFLGATKYLLLASDAAEGTGSSIWNDTTPTSSVFTVGTAGVTNDNAKNYVAYLFGSCPKLSKVGNYTGTGSTQTIDCGFTGGARFVLIKRTDSTGDWWVWDTVRGMVAGTDPRLALNLSSAQTNANWVYTTTGGFQIVTSDATVNASGGTYIYLAIA